MAFLNFRRNPDNELEAGGGQASQTAAEKKEVSCPNCHRAVAVDQLGATLHCCPHCGHHFTVSARARIAMITDRNSFKELFSDVVSNDPLSFSTPCKPPHTDVSNASICFIILSHT